MFFFPSFFVEASAFFKEVLSSLLYLLAAATNSYAANFPPLTPELRDALETSSINGELFTRAYDLAA